MCSVCHDYDDKAEDEAVAVVEPVRSLEPVPDEVDRRRVEAEHEEAHQRAVGDLLSRRDLPYHEEHGQ